MKLGFGTKPLSLAERPFVCAMFSHQSVGAHYLGLQEHTKNMMMRFASNITASKDWCSYWEINRYDLPAPVDYKDDEAFWYNLPANFDLLIAAWKQFSLTGDIDFLQDPVMTNFYEKSMTEYIQLWQIDAPQIMSRDRFVNLDPPIDSTDNFQICRGLPSYGEEQPLDTYLGADLLCLQFQAYKAYGNMAKLLGQDQRHQEYFEKAKTLSALFHKHWWDSTENKYASTLFNSGQYVYKPNRYLLISGIPQTRDQLQGALEALINQSELNIESQSYLPMIFYREDLKQEAYQQIMDLTDPQKERRDYPEVAFSVVESVIEGAMGITTDANQWSITTLPRLTDQTKEIALNNVPIFDGTINISHQGNLSTTLENHTEQPILWKATLPVGNESLAINGLNKRALVGITASGVEIAQVEYLVNPGERITVSAPIN